MEFGEGCDRIIPGGGFGALFGMAGWGDETGAGGPRSMARYSGAADPGVAQLPKGRIPAGATESAPKTPSEIRVPQIRSETTPSRSAGDPDSSPALL